MSLLMKGVVVAGSLLAVGLFTLLALADKAGISPLAVQRFTTLWVYFCLAVFGVFWMVHTWKKK